KNCGNVTDACGATINCDMPGGCPTGQSCGGTGTANVCGVGNCTPTTCLAQNKNCGDISDGCSTTLHCGSCTAPQPCGGGGNANRTCVANVCTKNASCTPRTACAAGQCGILSDGCGDVLSCPACATGKSCVNNVCQ